MEPGNLKFGGGLDHSQLHPFVLVAMLLAIVLASYWINDEIYPDFH